jgi:hypothetical protein
MSIRVDAGAGDAVVVPGGIVAERRVALATSGVL